MQQLETSEVYWQIQRTQERLYTIGNLEYLSASVLYSGDSKSGPSDGSGKEKLGEFEKGSFGNLFTNYDLGELTGDKNLSGWKLQERFDFKDPSNPHINYGITSPKGGYLKDLGDSHKIDLDF